jgi:general secretion pathway protein K
MPRPLSSARQSGFALVLVLVGVALLALMAETVLLLSSRAARQDSAFVSRAQLACTAQAGIALAIASLLDPHRDPAWRLDGAPHPLVFNGQPLRVSIAAEAGKVDLNGASPALLAALFSAAGLDAAAAQTLAARVLDWREPSPLKRLNGAKPADYRAAGLPYGPRLGPFQSISELNLVLGMTPDLYARVAPSITVYSVLPTPQLQSAPPLALAAAGLNPASIEAIMAARAQSQVAPSLGLPPNLQPPQPPGLPNTVFTLTATASATAQTVTRTETIRLTGNPSDPIWILSITEN